MREPKTLVARLFGLGSRLVIGKATREGSRVADLTLQLLTDTGGVE